MFARARTSTRGRALTAREASVVTAVGTLLGGRLVEVMGEVPHSKVGPAISFKAMAQTNRSQVTVAGVTNSPDPDTVEVSP